MLDDLERLHEYCRSGRRAVVNDPLEARPHLGLDGETEAALTADDDGILQQVPCRRLTHQALKPFTHRFLD